MMDGGLTGSNGYRGTMRPLTVIRRRILLLGSRLLSHIVSQLQMSLQLPRAHQILAAHGAFDHRRRQWLRVIQLVQSRVFVQVGRVAEGACAHAALERLVAGVRAQVDLQTVLARVDLAAVDAPMAAAARHTLLAHVCRQLFHVECAVVGGVGVRVLLGAGLDWRCDWSALLRRCGRGHWRRDGRRR